MIESFDGEVMRMRDGRAPIRLDATDPVDADGAATNAGCYHQSRILYVVRTTEVAKPT